MLDCSVNAAFGKLSLHFILQVPMMVACSLKSAIVCLEKVSTMMLRCSIEVKDQIAMYRVQFCMT